MRELGLVAQPTSTAIIIEKGPVPFGEGSALGCSRRLDEAIRDQTELLTIPGEDFRQTLSLVPNLRWRVLKRYVERPIKSVYHDKVKLCLALPEMQLPELVEGRTYEAPQSSRRARRPRAGPQHRLGLARDPRQPPGDLGGPLHELEPLMLKRTRTRPRRTPPEAAPARPGRGPPRDGRQAPGRRRPRPYRRPPRRDGLPEERPRQARRHRARDGARAGEPRQGRRAEPLGAPPPLGASSPPAS